MTRLTLCATLGSCFFLRSAAASDLAGAPFAGTAEATPAATLSGTVTDSTGGVLVGASLILRGVGGSVRSASTDSRGRYRFDRVPFGAYILVGTQDHFRPTTVELKVERNTMTADLTLGPASLTEEVTVSFTEDRTHAALKSDAAIRDIPMTAKTYTQSFIKALDVKQVNELFTYMNGVNKFLLDGAVDTLIRGFGSSPTNTLQINGMPGLTTRMASPDIANIERVEVLKGPLSVLYGRTQPGGMVNFVTKQPQAEPQYRFDLRMGTFCGTGPGFADRNSYRGAVDLTGPLGGSKTFLYRLVLSYDNLRDFRDFAKKEDLLVAPSLTWNISPGTVLTLEGDYRTVSNSMDWYLVAPRNDIKLAAAITTRYQEPDDSETDHGRSVSAHLMKAFATGLTWNVTVRAVRQNDERIGFETESLTNDFRVRRRDRDQDNKRDYYFLDTTFARRLGKGPLQHSLLVGFGGGYELRHFDRAVFGPLGFFIDVYHPVYGQARPAVGNIGFDRFFYFRDSDIYAQDRLDLGRQWKGLVGLRYQLSNTSIEERRLSPTGTLESKTFNHVDPVVGLVFQPDARWSLYGSITTAFDPQTTVGVDAQGNSDFEPETARQFESGVKAELANGRIDTTLALFDITKANILVPIGGNVFDAVGQARSRGLEFDLRVKPVDNWQTILGYAYTDAKVTEDRRAVRVGAALVGNSKHALNLWSRYDATSGAVRGLGLGAGLIWRGDRPGSFPGDLVGPGFLPYVTLPHYLRLDAGIYYARGRSELTLKVNNVLDTLYYESSQLAIRILPGSPREALVSWRFRI